MRKRFFGFAILLISSSGLASGQDPAVEGIRPTPLTRPELKRLLEDVKIELLESLSQN